jgi:hypothetical protein
MRCNQNCDEVRHQVQLQKLSPNAHTFKHMQQAFALPQNVCTMQHKGVATPEQ